MAKILVLGAGRVGHAIARDLSARHAVTAADRDAGALDALATHGVTPLRLDLADRASLADALTPFDFVVCAVPGFMGYATLETILDAGKDVVDISFFPEDALALDERAKAHGVTAIVDAGVAPGLGNVILGHHDATMTVRSFACLVGGLPVRRTWPFAYKAPFSPIDVIEEYTRPARYVEHGEVVVRPALTDVEHVAFAEVGTLEAFNTDGLRSLIHTMPHIPDMKEKTLRYPGHARFISALQAAGFFAEAPLTVGGASVRPLDFTAKILIDAWHLEADEPEFTVLRVTITGEEDGAATTYVYELYDARDAATGFSSMARTTGFTCTALSQLFLDGGFTEHGVFPPEIVGRQPGVLPYVRDYLAERGVAYRVSKQTAR